MEIKTSELSSAALDWAVLVAIGGEADMGLCHSGKIWGTWGDLSLSEHFCPSENWAQAGPLIDSFKVCLDPCKNDWWEAKAKGTEWMRSKSPLISACRAIVASKLGDTVSVPNELEG